MEQLLNEPWTKLNMKDTKIKTQGSKIVSARSSFVRTSPRKMRLVANAVRKMDPNRAVEQLKIMPWKAAAPLLAVFQQALANAKNNFQLSPADMVIFSLQVGEGPHGAKKADVHAHGARFARGVRQKKLSHISLELVERSQHGT
jgi:large subunit ribosomal protein L22